MSNPLGVDANAVSIISDNFTTDNAGYTLKLTTRCTITNGNNTNANVNFYVVLDGVSIDALPLFWVANGGYRQEFNSYYRNIPSGTHTIQVYAAASIGNVNWVWVDMGYDIFKA